MLAVALFLVACRTFPQSRVVRLAFESASSNWRLSVNGTHEASGLSASKLTNELAALRLHQGDVILMRSLVGTDNAAVQGPNEWLSEYCASNSVAVYIYALDGPATDMFSVVAFHWTAPYDNPFDLPSACFFCEGRLLGRGTSGFESMLHLIARDRPRKLLILGSLFDTRRYMDAGWPWDPSPYSRLRGRLDSVMKAAGTDLVFLSVFPE